MSYTIDVRFKDEDEQEKFKVFMSDKKTKLILEKMFSRPEFFEEAMFMNMNKSNLFFSFLNVEKVDILTLEEYLEEYNYDPVNNSKEIEENYANYYNDYHFNLENQYMMLSNMHNSTLNIYNLYIWLATKSSVRYDSYPVIYYDEQLKKLISLEEFKSDMQNKYQEIIIDENGFNYLPEVTSIDAYRNIDKFMQKSLILKKEENDEQVKILKELDEHYKVFEQAYLTTTSKPSLKAK